jgi:hypothetical protein
MTELFNPLYEIDPKLIPINPKLYPYLRQHLVDRFDLPKDTVLFLGPLRPAHPIYEAWWQRPSKHGGGKTVRQKIGDMQNTVENMLDWLDPEWCPYSRPGDLKPHQPRERNRLKPYKHPRTGVIIKLEPLG